MFIYLLCAMLQSPTGLHSYNDFNPTDSAIIKNKRSSRNRTRELQSYSPLYTIEGHISGVHSVSFRNDGRQIASGSFDDTVKVWDIGSDWQLRYDLEWHSASVESIVYNPESPHIIASGSIDCTIKIWDLTDGSILHTLEGHTKQINSLSYSSDGTKLASGSNDGTIKIWDMTKNGSLFRTIIVNGNVESVSYGPDSSRLASASDNIVKIWDMTKDGLLLYSLQGHTKKVQCVTYNFDGSRLASASWDQSIKIWDMTNDDGSLFQNLVGHSDQVHSIAYNHDGSRLASGSDDNTIKIWDTTTTTDSTSQLLQTLKDHDSNVRTVAYSFDGSMLASGSWDKTIKIWNVPPSNSIPSADPPRSDGAGPLQGKVGYMIAIIVGLMFICMKYRLRLRSIWAAYRREDNQISTGVASDATIELQPFKESSIETPFLELKGIQ